MEISFSKYTGCGNDFILIDNRASNYTLDSHAIANLCDRNYGIGGDGIIFLEDTDQADFRMRIYNANGSEAEMCGNGLRCLGRFLIDLGYPEQAYSIKTMERILQLDFCNEKVIAYMGDLSEAPQKLSVAIEGDPIDCLFLNTGVPHSVTFCTALDTIAVSSIGRKIRHHPHFMPKGTNVNFAERLSDHQIKIRTFERGVEAETWACGTGATASAIAMCLKWNLAPPIEVYFSKGDHVIVNFIKDREAFSQITQTGPALKLFRGTFDIRGYL